jgi:hypothetical protein
MSIKLILKINETVKYFKCGNIEYILEDDNFNHISFSFDSDFNVLNIESFNYNSNITVNNSIFIVKKIKKPYYINDKLINNQYLVMIIYNNNIKYMDVDLNEANLDIILSKINFNFRILSNNTDNYVDNLINYYFFGNSVEIINNINNTNYEQNINNTDNFLLLNKKYINIADYNDVIQSIINTDINGKYNISSTKDATVYDFQIEISSLSISSPAVSDAQSFNQKVLSQCFVDIVYGFVKC